MNFGCVSGREWWTRRLFSRRGGGIRLALVFTPCISPYATSVLVLGAFKECDVVHIWHHYRFIDLTEHISNITDALK